MSLARPGQSSCGLGEGWTCRLASCWCVAGGGEGRREGEGGEKWCVYGGVRGDVHS